MSRFGIRIDLPKHGWLPCEVTFGDETVSFQASFVLEDPGYEMVTAALSLLKHKDSAEICWWTEPNWHTMRIDHTLDPETLSISFFENHADQHRPDFKSPRFDCCSTTEFCQSVAFTFREVLGVYGREAYEEGAGKLFPEERINEIYRELHERKYRGRNNQ